MLFYRPPVHKNRWHTHAVKHHKMCTQFLSVSAFIVLCLVGVMLFLAIRSQHSEQKTVFWIIFALSLVGLFIIIGFLIYQMQRLFHYKKLEDKIKAQNRSSNRIVIPTVTPTQDIQINRMNSDLGVDNPQFSREPTMDHQPTQRETRIQINPKYQVY